MKIAIVHPSLAVRGGAEQVVLWLAEELSRRGYGVTIITTDFDARLYGPREGRPYAILTLPLGGYTYDPVQYLRAGWALRGVLEGFDCVNPHNFPAYVWVAVARALNPRIARTLWFCEEPVRWFYPQVCNRHMLELRRRKGEGVDRWPRWPRWRRTVSNFRQRLRNWRWGLARVMDRWAVRRLDRVLANSAFIAGQVQAIFGVPARPCLLGIPIHRFNGQGEVAQPLPPAPYVLTVTRLFPEKNVENILAALVVLREQGALPFRRYVIAGDGPLRSALETTAARWGLRDAVEFTGPVSDARLAALYRHASLVVYLPLDETFGLVFLEAALCKRAVLGPNHGGPTELIQHGVTGLQVDPLNPREIAQALVYSLSRPDLLRQYGEAGHQRTLQAFTFAHFVDRFEAEIRDLLRGR